MAINGNRTRRAAGDEQKATGYLNVFITDANGKRKKIGSMPLQSGNSVHEQVDKFLRDNLDDGVPRLFAKLDVEYNPVDDTPPDLGLENL
jgi:hypothetical protein